MARFLGENPAIAFLAQSDESNPAQLFRDFAYFLLTSAKCWDLPVPVEKTYDHYQLRLGRGPLERQRGIILGNMVGINSNDRATAQHFSSGHELMELLVRALQAEGLSRFSAIDRAQFDQKKEE